MLRGTTPELSFEMPFDCELISKLHIAFAQGGELGDTVVLEKLLQDCTIEGRTLHLRLSEEDTLKLQDGDVFIQLRLEYGGDKLGSCVIKRSVDRILKDGLLNEITS